MVMVRSDNNIRRIGVFGGTFNPIHHGHLINIEFLKEEFDIDMVLFIPVRIPVHKILEDNVSPEDRLKMVDIAINGIDGFMSSDLELKRESASYTITTLEEVSGIYPEDKLFLIIGSDSFNELDTWKEYKKILSCYNVIVMKRAGNEILRDDLLAISGNVEFFCDRMIEISSSLIRSRIKKGLTVKYLTTDSVMDYILEKGLYKIG